MAFKVFVVIAFVAVVNAAVIPDLVAHPEAPAHYNFGYQVNDPVTGDSKHQEETRDGDVVHGSYSLVESDGTRRVVEYTADDVNGFNAVVHKEPAGQHVVTAPATHHVVTAPVAHHVVTAPVAHHVVTSPVAHHVVATPVARHVIAAPVAHHVATPIVSTRVAALPAVSSYSGLYSPYHAYSHPVYSGYNNLNNYVY